MRLVQLKNHSERQDFLRKAATIASEDQAVDKSHLTEELITRSQELHKKYQEENANLGKANTEKSAQVESQFLAMQELRQGISHFHAVVSMRNKRLGLPKSYLKMYQIPQDQNVSSITSLPELIRLANNCISGDAQSKLKGKDPMVNPSPEEKQSLIEDAEKEEKAYNAADRDLVDIQNKLKKAKHPLSEGGMNYRRAFNTIVYQTRSGNRHVNLLDLEQGRENGSVVPLICCIYLKADCGITRQAKKE